jgi:hypothetical protein
MRGIGRRYEDELKQYTSDRMILQGDSLKEKYGSEKEAKKAIALDFKNQQKVEREIREVEKEVTRRRKAGWEDADINSKEGGAMLDKLNALLDKYASYDPTNTGRQLETSIDPRNVDPSRVPMEDRFNANRTVHRDYKGQIPKPAVWKVHPDRGAVPEPEPEVEEAKPTFKIDKNGKKRDLKGRFIKEEPIPEPQVWRTHPDRMAPVEEAKPTVIYDKNGKPRDPSTGRFVKPQAIPTASPVVEQSASVNALQAEENQQEAAEADEKMLEQTQKQTDLLEKIKDALLRGNSGAGEAKEMPAAGGIMDMLKGGISSLPGMLKGVGNAVKGLSKVAAPLAAAYAVGDGVMDEANGKRIENASDIIPEGTLNKLNPFAYAMNGGRYVGNKINQGYGAASEFVGGSGSLGSDIGGLFKSDAEKKADAMLKSPAAPAKLNPVPSNKAFEVAQSTSTVNDAKAAKASAPITVVAPTTVNNSSGGTRAAPTPQGPVRNDESTLARYVRDRYAG